MSLSPHPEDRPIETTGLWLFGGLSIVLVLGKLIGLWAGSWWWIVLPIMTFGVFNGLYIAIGFLYLTVTPVRERPEDEEHALLSRYKDGVSYGSGFLFVVGFVVNLVSRLEGAGGFRSLGAVCGSVGDAGAVWGVFGDQSVALLVADWSSSWTRRRW